MVKLQDVPCQGCTTCPWVASSDPADAISFTMQVNCLGPRSGRLSIRDPSEQRMPPPMSYQDFMREEMAHRQMSYRHQRPLHPGDLHLSQGELERQQEERDRRALAEIDRDAMTLCMRVPQVEPFWTEFVRRTGYERTPAVARVVLTMISKLIQLFSPEGARAEVVRTHKELIDLCERVVRAWDEADDKMEMRDAIEELDSLLYDMDKREGLSGT